MFGAVSLTKNNYIDQYKCNGYGIGFYSHGEFSFGNGYGRNCIIFGADLSSSVHANNRKNTIVLGKDFVQGINSTTIYAEQMYSINFTENNKKFALSLHYNGANSYLFVSGREIHKFTAKSSEVTATPLCLGNISKDFSVDNIKKTGLNGYAYDFSVDYDDVAVDDILDIHKYLMEKKWHSIKCLGLIKKCLLQQFYIPGTVRSINLRVFNLIQRINETKHIIWHETCKCVCRLSAAICDSKQIWNDD